VSYPVTFQADYVERRSRLTTFFRWLLVIPQLIVMYLYGLVAGLVVIVAWFALLFTGRYPQGMYDFVAGFIRYSTYVNGYYYLLCDPYPPFSGDPAAGYPVRLEMGPPKESYNRLKVLFRIILAIPVLLITYAMQIVAGIGSFIAWFAIVILGRQPRGLQDMIALGVSYQQRAYPYFALLTEDWPPFIDESQRRVEPAPAFGAVPAAPPAAGLEPPVGAPERPAEDELSQPAPGAPTPPAEHGAATRPSPEPTSAPAEHDAAAQPPPEPTSAPSQEGAQPEPPSTTSPQSAEPQSPLEPPPVADDDAAAPPPERRDDEERPPGPFGPSGT
jgi:uncharacterized protein DUF4389